MRLIILFVITNRANDSVHLISDALKRLLGSSVSCKYFKCKTQDAEQDSLNISRLSRS